MGSLLNEGGVKEVKVDIKNVEDEMKRKLEQSSAEIPPLDVVKDYEELGLIIDLGEAIYENAGIDFNAMFSDFFPEDEEKVIMEITPSDESEILEAPVAPQPSNLIPSLMELEKLMDISFPDGEGSSFTNFEAEWDFDLMEWLWSPCGYEEFIPYINQD